MRAWVHALRIASNTGMDHCVPSAVRKLSETDRWKLHTFDMLIRKVSESKSVARRSKEAWFVQGAKRLWRRGNLTDRVKMRRSQSALVVSKSLTDVCNSSKNLCETAGDLYKDLSTSISTSIRSTRIQILSIGDSEAERRALLTCRQNYYSNGFFKSIKLVENSHPLLLKRQQEFIISAMLTLLNIQDCVDLVFDAPVQSTQIKRWYVL